MNRTDFLRQQRTTSHTILHRFVLLYRKKAKDIYVFFEGNDDCSYYMPELRRRRGNISNIYHFNCNGKSNVIDVYKKVIKKVNNINRTLFFIDKDIDDIAGVKNPSAKNIYTTDYYSIENYLVTDDVFRAIWTDIFHLSDTGDIRFSKYLLKFRSCHKKFNIAIKQVMGWVIHERKNNNRLILQNLNMDKVVSFTQRFEVRRKKNGLKYFAGNCGLHYSAQKAKDVKKVIQGLNKLKPKKYIRGKFEMWFFVKFINKVSNIVKKGTNKYKRAKIRQSINLNNAVEILASRCPYPNLLTNFLDYNLSRIK